MKKNVLNLLCLITLLALPACGTTVLVKQEATNAVIVGKNAISEINKFHSYIFDTQNQLAAGLIARYPSCNFGDSIVIHTYFPSNLKQEKNNGDGLCLSDKELKEWQSANDAEKLKLGQKVDLVPLERSALKSSMDILNAFALYLDAISKHTVSPNTPIANNLKEVTDQLVAVQGKIKLLPDAVGSKLAQSAAVGEFIGYLEKLIQNSNDAKEITKIVATEGEAQEHRLFTVAVESDSIFSTYVASMSATLTTTLGDYYNKNKGSKEFESFDKKQSFLIALFKQKQLDRQIQTSSSPGAKAIKLFVSAHRKLRDAITGNFSEEQKAFILEENMKELKEGLQDVANLAQFAMAIAG